MPIASVTRHGPSGPSLGTASLVPSGSIAPVADCLEQAGIHVNGSRPWDIQIRDSRFFRRVLRQGSLGLGESYMDGWWDADCLDELFLRLHRAEVYRQFRTWDVIRLWLLDLLFNRQSPDRSESVGHQHYDIGNDLFETMLDSSMQYTCAYWKTSATLEQAQQNKLNLIAGKLHLQPGMRVLELGGGFGGLARFLALRHGCEVVSYNIAPEQTRYARELCRGLPVRFVEADYREAAHEPKSFDRVVSIGLCEHVGHKNYRAFLDLARHALAGGGLFLLHTIGANASFAATDPWIDRYIFPNGMMPSIAQLGRAAEHNWVVEDWHNFGPDYDRTLLAWWQNFNQGWSGLQACYGDRFYRMWKYYLLASAGAFRARKLQLWQIVLSAGDISAYAPVR